MKNNYKKSIIFFSLFLMLFNTFALPSNSTPLHIHNSPRLIRSYKGVNEYLLSNGMKVILKQNHKLPLATFSVWYRVGSRNEHDGIRGIAHFLEHMMFKGTKKLKSTEISTTIQKCGGVFNAFTFSDGTAYYETIPSRHLPKIIQLEADRMQNSLLEQKEINLEKNVVISELEGGKNNPAIVLNEQVKSASFENSPYKHPVIGYREDVDKVTSPIMKAFYKKYYVPNNSFIILVGDFNEKNILKTIDSSFGYIKPSNDLNVSIPRDIQQLKQKRVKVSKNGTFKIFQISYHIPEVSNEDIYALSILDELLFKGKKSPLHKKLIDSGLATDVSGGCDFTVDPGMFSLIISLTPKATHKKVESVINTEIKKFLKYGPSVQELQAAKNRSKALYNYSLDGSYNEVVNLGFYEIVDDWALSFDILDKLNNLTPNEVVRISRKYFTKENSTVGEFIPILRPGEKYVPGSVNLSTSQHYKDVSRVINAPNSLSINSGTNRFPYTKNKLANNSVLLHYSDIDLPITYISGVLPGGSSVLEKNKELSADLIVRSLMYGSKNYTKADIENFYDETGSIVNFSSDEEGIKFDIVTLNEHLLPTVKLFTDILLNPNFNSKYVNQEKSKLIAELIESKDDNRDIARRKMTQILYPQTHPYYRFTVEQDIKNIKSLTLKDIKSAHEILLDSQVVLSLVSNIDPNTHKELIALFNSGIASDIRKPFLNVNLPHVMASDLPKSESIFVSGKEQSDVYLTHLSEINRQHPDFYKLHLANYILGGSLLINRLALKVRDQSGLVYTIQSYLYGTFGAGEFNIYFGSNNKNVDKSLSLIESEMAKFVKNGVTQSELTQAKIALIDSYSSKYLSSFKSICNTLLSIERYKLGDDYIKDYPKIINSITLTDVNSAIKKYIHPTKLNVVIAGEYSKQQ